MKEVFVSFQTADEAVARQATRKLEALGLSCWLCTRGTDNLPGVSWTRTLAQALIVAQTVLCLYSRHAAASPYVFREIAMAVALQKPILVVRLDDSEFAPELGYLVRTLQMLGPVAGSEDEWLTTVGEALRVLLPSHCPLPLDSIADRQFKVRFCRQLHQEVFGDAAVRLHGAAVWLPHVVQHHLDRPQPTRVQLRALEQAVTDLAYVRRTAPVGCCVPFWAAEDRLLAVWLAGRDRHGRELTGPFRRLPADLAQVLAGLGPFPDGGPPLPFEVRTLPARSWRPSDGEDSLEAFFADLGGERAQAMVHRGRQRETRGSRWPRLDAAGARLLARLAQAASGEAHGPATTLQLPKAMTCLAAEEQLRSLLAST